MSGCASPLFSVFVFQRILIALVHALTNSGHDGGGKIKRGVEHIFFNSHFPGGRQAMVHSGLTVADNGDGDSDEGFLAVGEQVRCVGIAVVFSKIGSFTHINLPCGRGLLPDESLQTARWNRWGDYRQSAQLIKAAGVMMLTRTYGWSLLAILYWGLLPTVAGGALSETHPAWVLTGAFIASSLVFAYLPPVMGLPPVPEPEAALARWRGRLLDFGGLFFPCVYFEAIPMNYLWPLFIMLLAWVVLRDPFRLAIAAGCSARCRRRRWLAGRRLCSRAAMCLGMGSRLRVPWRGRAIPFF